MKRLAVGVLFLSLVSCSQPQEATVQVIVGAAVVDGENRVIIPHSVVVIKDGKIEALGPQPTTPVPRDSTKVDGTGKFIAAAQPGISLTSGGAADLLLLTSNPAEDLAFRDKVERRMVAGRWVQ